MKIMKSISLPIMCLSLSFLASCISVPKSEAFGEISATNQGNAKVTVIHFNRELESYNGAKPSNDSMRLAYIGLKYDTSDAKKKPYQFTPPNFYLKTKLENDISDPELTKLKGEVIGWEPKLFGAYKNESSLIQKKVTLLSSTTDIGFVFLYLKSSKILSLVLDDGTEILLPDANGEMPGDAHLKKDLK